MRYVRLSDELWADVLKSVAIRGDGSASAIIRAYLIRYVRETERMVARKEAPSNRGAKQHGRPNRGGRSRPPS